MKEAIAFKRPVSCSIVTDEAISIMYVRGSGTHNSQQQQQNGGTVTAVDCY
jgi:hypothetical protein